PCSRPAAVTAGPAGPVKHRSMRASARNDRLSNRPRSRETLTPLPSAFLSPVTLSLEMGDRLDAVGDSELRETLLFARSQALPVTADDVAVAHRIHRNVARGRLERLADAGLLIPGFERRTGRTGPGAGRPAKTYRVAPELSAIEFPERRYDQLIGLVARALPERTRVEGLRGVGADLGREPARRARLQPATSFRTALRRVCPRWAASASRQRLPR